MSRLYLGTKRLRSVADDAPTAVYLADFDHGALNLQRAVAFLLDPSFLACHPLRSDILYAVAESSDGFREESLLATWKIEADGSLTLLKTLGCGGTCGCHLSVHPSGKFLFVACYVSGQLAIFSLDAWGVPQRRTQLLSFVGRGPHPVRQQSPHIHFVQSDPAGEYVLATDLGSDRIVSLALREGVWEPVATCVCRPGCGPRHGVFSADGTGFFVINELDGSLDRYRYTHGILTLEKTTRIPEGGSGGAIATTGRFLYVSLRGTSEIGVLDGDLRLLQRVSSGGVEPRFAGLTPDGAYLLVCNQGSRNIRVYQVLEEGTLQAMENDVEIPWPAAAQFVEKP
ncbi:MAG: lactonase family protein [Planctomycetia bacterium]|nr:lactonase family protein [Planctomycetia bacterium]